MKRIRGEMLKIKTTREKINNSKKSWKVELRIFTINKNKKRQRNIEWGEKTENQSSPIPN